MPSADEGAFVMGGNVDKRPELTAEALCGKRVAICEDEGMTIFQLRMILKRAGLYVSGHQTGALSDTAFLQVIATLLVIHGHRNLKKRKSGLVLLRARQTHFVARRCPSEQPIRQHGGGISGQAEYWSGENHARGKNILFMGLRLHTF